MLAVGLVYLTALSGLACGLWWATMVHHEMELILVLLFVNITNLISTGKTLKLFVALANYLVTNRMKCV